MFNKYAYSKEDELKLREAASKNDTATLISLKGKVDINSAGPTSKQTAAHRAAAGGHINTLQLLFNLGADFSLVDKNGNTPRDLAKTEEAKKLFMLIEEGYAAIAARKSIFLQTDEECDPEISVLHQKYWDDINEKIQGDSEYKSVIIESYGKEARNKVLTEKEIKQFDIFSEKFALNLRRLENMVAKEVILKAAKETHHKICSCGQAAAASFVWLAYFKNVGFSVEELNLMSKVIPNAGHVVLILNRDQTKLLTDYSGWQESLIIDPYRNTIFFFNFVSHYSQDTCLKMAQFFDLLIGASNVMPPFPTQVILPNTMRLYTETVETVRNNILALLTPTFTLIENKEPGVDDETCALNSL